MRATKVIALVLLSALATSASAGQSALPVQQASVLPPAPSGTDPPCAPEVDQIIKHLSIEYPNESQENQTQGSARVELTIDSTGRVAAVNTVAGLPNFTDAVAKAANKWTKDPIIEEGLKKPLVLEVDVDFKIDLEPHPPVEFPAITNTDDLAITMERSGCYGSCPVYRLKIHGDGTVEYEGDSYVFLKGNHRARISKGEFGQLLENFRTAGYFSLDDKYIYRRPSEILMSAQGCNSKLRWLFGMTFDLPSTVTSITIGGTTKQVDDYDGAPPELRQLESQIDQLAHSDRWLRGTTETVAGLRAENYDINLRNPNGWTAILGASEYSDAQIVRDFISVGANVNVSNSEGHTPLMFAPLRGLPDVEEELLRVGADARARDSDGRNVLMCACSGGNEAVVAELLQTHLDINARSKDGNTPLMAAAASGNPRIVKLILSAKPRVNGHGHNGTTALIAGSTGELEWETEYAFGPSAEVLFSTRLQAQEFVASVPRS